MLPRISLANPPPRRPVTMRCASSRERDLHQRSSGVAIGQYGVVRDAGVGKRLAPLESNAVSHLVALLCGHRRDHNGGVGTEVDDVNGHHLRVECGGMLCTPSHRRVPHSPIRRHRQRSSTTACRHATLSFDGPRCWPTGVFSACAAVPWSSGRRVLYRCRDDLVALRAS